MPKGKTNTAVEQLSTEKSPTPIAKEHWYTKITGVSLVDKLFFLQNLEVMLRTGFSISDALRTLLLQTKNQNLQIAIQNLQMNVEKGKTLSKSMEQYPKIFSDLLVRMVNAGEISGQLDKTLKQITIQLKKSYTLRKKIINALIYPAIILSAMLVIGTGMLIFVFPKILDLYSSGGYNLPLPTKILIAVTTFMSKNAIPVSVIIVGSVVAFGIAIRTSVGKRIWHTIILRLPIAGKILVHIQLAQFYRILHSLLKTDIPVVQSFQIIEKTLGLIPYREIINQAAEKIKEGKSIHECLNQNQRLFPPVTLQMMKVGEESGTLDEISGEIAEFFEEEVDSTMGNLTVIIEPVLMLILGAGVAIIAVAVVMPIYSLVNQV